MRALLRTFADLLPLDRHGRRIIRETLLDWTHEAGDATGMWRVIVECRGVLALVRAVAGIAMRETVAVPYGWLMGQVLLVAGVPAALLLASEYRWFGQVAAEGSPRLAYALGAVSVAHDVVVLLPLVFFVVMLRPGHARRPAIGVAIVAVAVTLGLGGWVEPIGNQRFWALSMDVWAQKHPHSSFGAPGPVMTVATAVALAWTRRDLFVLVTQPLGTNVGLSVLAGSFVLLAHGLRRNASRWDRRTTAILSLAAPVYFCTLELLMWGDWNAPSYTILRGHLAQVWLIAGALLAIVAVIRMAVRKPTWLAIGAASVAMLWLALPSDWPVLYEAWIGSFAPWVFCAVVLTAYVAARRGNGEGADDEGENTKAFGLGRNAGAHPRN